jgi:hypothetical protein
MVFKPSKEIAKRLEEIQEEETARRVPRTIKREGYWYSRFTPEYPMPEVQDKPWRGKKTFIDKLISLQARVANKSLCSEDIDCRVILYRGWSTCRICDKRNGSSEFSVMLRSESVNWIWPVGYLHYIESHNVKPSPEFIHFVDSLQGDKK